MSADVLYSGAFMNSLESNSEIVQTTKLDAVERLLHECDGSHYNMVNKEDDRACFVF